MVHPCEPLPFSLLHIDLVFPSSRVYPSSPWRKGARGFPGRLDTRAVYTFIRYFSRVAAKAVGDYARRNTSRSAEAITMFLPSDDESSNPPSARFSPRYAVFLSHCAFEGLFIPWHMLGPFGGSHKGNSNVARGNANSRNIRERGLRGWAVFVCARHVDI